MATVDSIGRAHENAVFGLQPSSVSHPDGEGGGGGNFWKARNCPAIDIHHTVVRRRRTANSPTAPTTIITTTKTTSGVEAFLHLLKGYVGPGCLSLPWAVSQLGIWHGCGAIAVMATWTSYNCWTVVRLKRELLLQLLLLPCSGHQIQPPSQSSSPPTPSDATITTTTRSTEAAVPVVVTYPLLSQWLYGSRMEQWTKVCVCTQQLAIGTVFLSFVGANLRAVVFAVTAVSVSHGTALTVVLPLGLALAVGAKTNLNILAPFTAVGTALWLVGLGLIFTVVVLAVHHGDDRPPPTTVPFWSKTTPLALCAILYSFEGICLVLPVQSSMKHSENFGIAFVSAMVAAATMFALVAGLSVAAFGTVTNGSLTAFLLELYANDHPHWQNLLLLANVAVSLSVLLTYPLQLVPCFELLSGSVPSTTAAVRGSAIAEREQELLLFESVPRLPTVSSNGNLVADYVETQRHPSPRNNADRDWNHDRGVVNPLPTTAVAVGGGEDVQTRVVVVLVLLTYVAAIAIPNVESIIALAGALAGSSTALLLPPALQIAYHHKQQRRRHHHHVDYGHITTTTPTARDAAVTIFPYVLFAGGLIFMVTGTYAALMDIVKIYARHS